MTCRRMIMTAAAKSRSAKAHHPSLPLPLLFYAVLPPLAHSSLFPIRFFRHPKDSLRVSRALIHCLTGKGVWNRKTASCLRIRYIEQKSKISTVIGRNSRSIQGVSGKSGFCIITLCVKVFANLQNIHAWTSLLPSLAVNVACEWGFTKSNYQELAILSDKYASRGFNVLAFPSNDFHQEKDTNEEILEYGKWRDDIFSSWNTTNYIVLMSMYCWMI